MAIGCDVDRNHNNCPTVRPKREAFSHLDDLWAMLSIIDSNTESIIAFGVTYSLTLIDTNSLVLVITYNNRTSGHWSLVTNHWSDMCSQLSVRTVHCLTIASDVSLVMVLIGRHWVHSGRQLTACMAARVTGVGHRRGSPQIWIGYHCHRPQCAISRVHNRLSGDLLNRN